MPEYYVYILSSKTGTMYTGVTNDLHARVLQHKEGNIPGFTKRYKVNELVYYEEFMYVNNAIAREKQIKSWGRLKKRKLIRELNPNWKDLSEGWY